MLFPHENQTGQKIILNIYLVTFVNYIFLTVTMPEICSELYENNFSAFLVVEIATSSTVHCFISEILSAMYFR